MTSDSSRALRSLIADAFGACELEVEPIDGFPGVVSTVVTGREWRWTLFAQPVDEDNGVCVYSVFPLHVPEENRPAVAELATRLNYLLRYGNVEMDYDDGEVRVRTSAAGGPDLPAMSTIAELIAANVRTTELVFPALEQVGQDGDQPINAVLEVVRTQLEMAKRP